MPYVVRTERFEGPLHLLLDLIEKRKLLINDISLSQVADDFLSHIKELPELPLNETAEFVSLAATLLLIKSRSLLPLLTLTEEEQSDVASLERRLALLKLFRAASGDLNRAWLSTPSAAHTGQAPTPVFAPDRDTTAVKLKEAIERVLFAFPRPAQLPTAVVKTVISLEEMIVRLTERIGTQLKMSFREFSGHGKAAKDDIIVSFLALLELVKQGIIRAEQEGAFGDIALETDQIATPTYGA